MRLKGLGELKQFNDVIGTTLPRVSQYLSISVDTLKVVNSLEKTIACLISRMPYPNRHSYSEET
jgi:hypothetical protein